MLDSQSHFSNLKNPSLKFMTVMADGQHAGNHSGVGFPERILHDYFRKCKNNIVLYIMVL